MRKSLPGGTVSFLPEKTVVASTKTAAKCWVKAANNSARPNLLGRLKSGCRFRLHSKGFSG